MAGLGDLVVNLGMNVAGFNAGLASSNRGLTSLASGVSRSVSVIKGALAPLLPIAAAVGAAVGLGASVSAARTQIESQKKLEAVLKATGGAAGLTANQIATLASEMQATSNFGDEVTMSAAGVLATFKEIKGDVFKDALGAAQDLSAVMGQDLQSSTVQIGKALNDPIKGITALSRVGVSFTEQQKQQIKTLQASGDVLGAQKIILDELKSEFGGAAAAMADPLTQFWNLIGDVGESIGMLILPSLGAIAKAAMDILGPITSDQQGFADLGSQIGGMVSGVVQPFVSVFRTGMEWVAAGIRGLGPTIDWLQGMLGMFQEYISGLLSPAMPGFQTVFDFIVGGFQMLEPVVNSAGEIIISYAMGITELGVSIYEGLVSIASGVMEIFQPVFDAIGSLLAEWFPGLMGGITETGNYIGEVVGGIAFFFRHMSALSQIALIDLYTWVMDNVPGMEGFYTHFAATVVGVFSGIGAFIRSFVANVIAGFQEIVNFGIAAFGAVADAFAAMLDGKNPLAAFQESFTNTLASQTEVQGGGNPFAEFGKAFTESRNGMLSDIAAGGGLKNVLASRKEDLLAGIDAKEQKFQLALTAPDLGVPTSPAAAVAESKPATSGVSGGDLGKYTKTEAVQQGSKEAFSAIQGFLFGGDTAKQQLDVQRQQLDATNEQNEVLAEIRDGQAEDRARSEMEPEY